ncbi:hypothetical protein [Burkholderia lata]|uniref:hypothetical protein n=1 Tax=Burkholderia lata (strain ATCC 17760 / DSM 23089 / LMG 22485 / NCIMB 9086 / R18194 / 383) TaxID=482957 RepID=UPI001582D0BF|nr:hypothetical protein [Burkholderia lata]
MATHQRFDIRISPNYATDNQPAQYPAWLVLITDPVLARSVSVVARRKVRDCRYRCEPNCRGIFRFLPDALTLSASFRFLDSSSCIVIFVCGAARRCLSISAIFICAATYNRAIAHVFGKNFFPAFTLNPPRQSFYPPDKTFSLISMARNRLRDANF